MLGGRVFGPESRGQRWGARPLQWANWLRRRCVPQGPALPRPAIVVGNLAFGGRGKTPTVAVLATTAQALGLRPAILLRGYRSTTERAPRPTVVRGEDSTGTLWMRSVSSSDGAGKAAHCWAPQIGDEAAWLAARCPGVPVGVHPKRSTSAEAILSEQEIDLFFLDDGFQTAPSGSLPLVLLDPWQDPPAVSRPTVALREGPSALQDARWLAWVTTEDQGACGAEAWAPGAPAPGANFVLRRHAAGLVELRTGTEVDPSSLSGLCLCAGVGSPRTVERLANSLGLLVEDRIPVRNHQCPRPKSIASRGQPLLITEKDALGWAASSELPEATAYVLRL